MPNVEPPLPALPQGFEDRARSMVLARESFEFGHALMEGMIGQTVGTHLGSLPGADKVLEAGISPLTGTSPFHTYQYRRRGTNAVVFEHTGVIYMYALGSAAATNLSDHENGFIELLCDVLEAYRPEHLYVATFNRLIRSLDFSGRLYQVVKNHVEKIHCGQIEIEPRSPAGKAIWSTFAMVADMERDSIVQRLFAGQVNRYLEDRYILGAESVPPGYLLGEDGQVRVVPEEQAAVRQLIEMMANPSFTARQIVDAAGESGLSSPTIRRVHGEGATFGDLCRADSRVASLVDWLPTYKTGVVQIIHKNPFPGALRFRTLEVERRSPSDPGFVRFVYDWGLPEGGWADPETIASAARRTTGLKARRSKGGGGTHRRRKPLSGWVRWRDADTEYRITGTSAAYVLVRRPAPAEPEEAAS